MISRPTPWDPVAVQAGLTRDPRTVRAGAALVGAMQGLVRAIPPPRSAQALLVAGSCGRGQAVYRPERGAWASDVDLVLVTTLPGLSAGWAWARRARGAVPGVEVTASAIPHILLSRRRDLISWWLGRAPVLWGRAPALRPFTPPLWEAVRLLHNRAIEAVRSGLDHDALVKAALAAMDAASIASGAYGEADSASGRWRPPDDAPPQVVAAAGPALKDRFHGTRTLSPAAALAAHRAAYDRVAVRLGAPGPDAATRGEALAACRGQGLRGVASALPGFACAARVGHEAASALHARIEDPGAPLPRIPARLVQAFYWSDPRF